MAKWLKCFKVDQKSQVKVFDGGSKITGSNPIACLSGEFLCPPAIGKAGLEVKISTFDLY